jgi:hypothetical protein
MSLNAGTPLMDYVSINTLHRANDDLCILRNKPKGIEHLTYKMMTGVPIGSDYPKDAQITMSDKEEGIALSGLIGNTCGLLIVVSALKNLILDHDKAPDQIECLPLRILNHKKRLASDDYFIINPLGTEDCVDLEKSVIERTKSGAVVGIDELVLKRSRINPAKAIFRIKEDPHFYIARKDWLVKIKSLNLGVSNVNGKTLPVSE